MEIRRYITGSGTDVVGQWLAALRDVRARARIVARIARLSAGNFGDCKPLRQGVWELRIDYGPGYRLYYARIGGACILLLGGSDKRRQGAAIQRAIDSWQDYQWRTNQP